MLFFCLFFFFSLRGAPEEIREKVGIYAWGQLPQVGDPLASAAQAARSLGVSSFRTAISPYWDPRGPKDTLLPLDRKVLREDYREVLTSFPVVMLTAYDVASYDPSSGAPRYRRHDLASERWMLAEVREEFGRFAYELGKLNGEFFVSNWEMENDCPDDFWQSCLEYYQARLEGVVLGRERAHREGYPGKVWNVVEFTTIVPGTAPPWHLGLPPRRFSGLEAALHKLAGVEFVSYSAWNSISHTRDKEWNPRRIREDIADIRNKMEAAGLPANRLIVGEAGYLWDYDDPKGSDFRAVINAFLEGGVRHLYNWVLYDQPGQGVEINGTWFDQSRFGKFRLDGTLTPQGEAFRELLQNDDLGAGAPSPAQ